MFSTPTIRSSVLWLMSGLLVLPLLLTDSSAGQARATRSERPPNIIMYLADDIGREAFNSYGGTSYKTPNIDRLAADGMRFTRAYSTPLCTPTRVQLLPPVKPVLLSGTAALLVACLASASSISRAQGPPASPHHKVVGADAIQWKQLRPGAEIAVISGDPDKEGSPFVMRFRYSGKARIPPHWHPTDEHLTILTGTFRLGVGERGDESAATALGPGAYAFVAAKMAHYAWAEDGTTVQAHGIGPFVINYVNPADDPNKAGKK